MKHLETQRISIQEIGKRNVQLYVAQLCFAILFIDVSNPASFLRKTLKGFITVSQRFAASFHLNSFAHLMLFIIAFHPWLPPFIARLWNNSHDSFRFSLVIFPLHRQFLKPFSWLFTFFSTSDETTYVTYRNSSGVDQIKPLHYHSDLFICVFANHFSFLLFFFVRLVNCIVFWWLFSIHSRSSWHILWHRRI